MNFNNSKSEKFETSLNNQSRMQPCKLDESESKPNMALKKIGHELDMAETKCFTLKSELNYMMGVCQKAQTETRGRTSLQELMMSSKDSDSKSSFIHFDSNSEIMISNKIRNYEVLEKIHNVEEKPEESFDALRPSLRSAQFLSRKITDDDDITEKTDLKEEKRKELLNVTITPRSQLEKKFPLTITTMPIHNETAKADREYENLLSCYPEHVEESIEELTSKADEDYFCMIPSTTKRDLVGPELNLEIPDTAKARRAERRKRATKVDKRETNSKAGDATIPKARKRKGKLRSSVSKSTVTTRDTSYIGKKEAKKRKHRGHGIIHQQSNFMKHPKKSGDVVEIFHNTTLKNSNSAASSKYSKLDGQIKKHLTETANEKIQEISFSKCVNHEFHNKDRQNNHPQTLNYSNDFKETPVRSLLCVQQENKSQKHPNDPCLSTQDKTHECEHVVFNKCNDPTLTHNYETSTLASRLKRANRSYFSRYSFQNIPFVVGTSVTPSHNLGLNIQQVLSVMKTRQPIADNLTPLLIRKVSRGVKPASILLEQISRHDDEKSSLLDVSSQITGLFNNRENSGDARDKKLSALDLQRAGNAQNVRTLNADNVKMISGEDNDIFKRFHEKNNFYENHKIKQQSLSVMNKRNVSASTRNQQTLSKLSLDKEENIGDYKVRIPGSHNSKEIRDVLINLHNQFEEMNTKYEKLQLEIEKKYNNASLAKELSTLEKELNIKEEEINAVIGLYKEVSSVTIISD
ncbi:hypothetical protein DMN91_008009 [Ooceraea biroi]|uniref:Uncharacterized protein n=2 Tax=Ooceraea biroi TaxID=2015173 RepID=A0A3L8DGZ8_OOCBI|nr:hypothetical protein DMN91_008009 [Ooceraea biroi]